MSIESIIEASLQLVLDNDRNGGIRSVYVGGTLLAEDRRPDSDIDYIAIADDQFQEADEKAINRVLAAQRDAWNMDVKLRSLYYSELAGGPQRGFITTLIPAKMWLKRIPSFPLVWGNALRIEETIGPYTSTEEVRVQSTIIRSYIDRWRADPESFTYEWIPKAVLYLSAVESEARFHNDFTTSFRQLERQLASREDHIVHAALRHRGQYQEMGHALREEFVRSVEKYLIEIQAASRAWQ